jgi:hypothetical protein
VHLHLIIIQRESLQLGNRFSKLVLVCFNHLFKIHLYTLCISPNPDAILILEHSFYLSQQNHPQPVSFAAQKYIASNTPAEVGKAIEGIFKQYNKVSDDSKVDMIFKVIIENHMGEFNVWFDILFTGNFITDE